MQVRLLRIIVGALLGLGGGALAAKTAAIQMALSAGRPDALTGLFPDEPRLVLTSALLSIQKSGGSLDPELIGRANQAAAQAPLAAEPFILKAVEALLSQDDARAEVLLEEARRRAPRSTVAHLLLLDIYARTDQFEDAAIEMMAIPRLISGAGAYMVPELARLVQTPGAASAVANVLKKDPIALAAVLDHLVGTGAEPELILSVAGWENENRIGVAIEQWQAKLLERLVNRGDISRARSLWSKFSGVGEQPDGVQDGDFKGGASAPPFGWSFPASPDGAAEAIRGIGLQVAYYGRTDAVLAEQLLSLTPGRRYRMSFRAEVRSGDAGGSLAWLITCHRGNQQLAEIPIQIGSEPRTFSDDFAVPANCGAQWLRLSGTSPDRPREQSLTIRSLKVQRTAAR